MQHDQGLTHKNRLPPSCMRLLRTDTHSYKKDVHICALRFCAYVSFQSPVKCTSAAEPFCIYTTVTFHYSLCVLGLSYSAKIRNEMHEYKMHSVLHCVISAYYALNFSLHNTMRITFHWVFKVGIVAFSPSLTSTETGRWSINRRFFPKCPLAGCCLQRLTQMLAL